jgi:hypothetical protein
MLVSFHLEIVLILTQHSCLICAERNNGSEIVLDAPEELLGGVMRSLVLIRLETVLVSLQDRCNVCVKHIIGSEIILHAPDGTHR